MITQAHQDIIKKLVDLIGITSIMEVCYLVTFALFAMPLRCTNTSCCDRF